MDHDLSDWRTRYASDWARTIPTVLDLRYPYAATHVSHDADDVDVTPDRLHPAFHGCFDWHSSVHMHWSGIRLLTLARDTLDADAAAGLRAVLDQRLTAANIQVEAAYLRDRPRFERPYGWGWAAALAASAEEAAAAKVPGADAWAGATRPLFDAVADLVTDWLPKVAYPVRSGEHANLAFGLGLVHDAATRFERADLLELIADRARDWFGDDRDYPARWEPGGSDFLSPALAEADLMGRVLQPADYAGWLAGFLPDLCADGDNLLQIPQVLDRTDGKAVHLYGLALSRAWQLRRLQIHLSPDRRERMLTATAQGVRHVEREINEGDFMSTHWLVSFALGAVTAEPV
ncbi:DUF2891 family protein [Calidifontibacter terrae]